MTAYIGLTRIGCVRSGESIYVSAAAGAVGGVACQIARLLGLRVIASAGTDEKVRWLLQRASVNAAFNYKAQSVSDELTRVCPEGLDVYFDNVGGKHLEAVLPHMKNFGRIALCGMMEAYNAATATGPNNLLEAVNRRLTLKGFIVSDYTDVMAEFRSKMKGWINSGELHCEQTVVVGIENGPSALVNLFHGHNLGKTLVKVEHG